MFTNGARPKANQDLNLIDSGTLIVAKVSANIGMKTNRKIDLS